MFARRKLAKRFSLLLLEDEEDYVADWAASCKWPSNVEGNWQGLAALPGRLRLCTKSLFFEPDDVRAPIVRLEFASVVQLEAEGAQACVVGVNKVTKMKPNMADVPYVVERHKASTWVFVLTYAKLDSFMPLAQEQLVISRLPAADRLQLQDAAVKAREDAAAFDTSRLVEFSERLVWEGPAVQLSPLVREPGRLAVTDQRLYFQPLHNIAGDTPVRSHPLAAVAAVVRRRACLVPVGLELFMFSPALEAQLAARMASLGGPYWDGPSAFFTFRSEAAREEVLAAITAQPALGGAVRQLLPSTTSSCRDVTDPPQFPPTAATSSSSQPQQQQQQQQHVAAGQLLEASGGWLGRVMLAWQLGKISNFDYLLYLNLAAGRSFNDLAQWPVFPWVLKDYSSSKLDLSDEGVFRDLCKPMGAQTPSRLEVFRQRYHEMDVLAQHEDAAGHMPAPFMYGTHYSTPGYVMFWLVRAAPAHMLRLQGGRFDAPDRLFNSLGESWHSATSSTTDVKELIPEFFMPGGDFLVNGSQLALGIRQSGLPVNDVVLPPWASEPEQLLAIHRAALEAPYVSANLHHWIDLIFGHKQRGPAAVDADNVFYHLTYEGAVDISKVTSLQELKALETQINEFGQTPKQLFTHPHPPRMVQPPAPDPATVFSHTSSSSSSNPSGAQAAAQAGASGNAAAAAAAAGKARLKGGGEDAAGGALCFALLSTILAAAAPDIQASAAAEAAAAAGQPGAATAALAVPKGTAGGAGGSSMQRTGSNSSGLSLSPVSSSDLLSAAPCRMPSPLKASQQQQQQQQQQQDQQPRGTGLRSMLGRLSETATAAAGSAAARVASAMQSAGSGSASNGSIGSRGLAGMPVSSSKSGIKLSLSWMQQQFEEGLALSSKASGSSASSATEPAAPGTAAATRSGDGITSGSPPKAPSPSPGRVSPSPAAGLPPHAAGRSAAAGRLGAVGLSPVQWPRRLPEQLLVKKSLRLQQEPLTAVAALPDGHVVVAGHSGLLRVLEAPQLSTIRSAKLSEEDLLCISLLPAAPSAMRPSAAAAAAGVSRGVGVGSSGSLSPSSSGVDVQLPLVLTGSQTGRVFAYAAIAGQPLGSFSPHNDAVSSMLQLGHAGGRLATASWDCTVKVWDVSEGRQPWSSTLPLPSCELALESGVWALSSSASGQLLVTGTDEGTVAAWDLRTQQQIWATQVSSDYVGGVSLLPGGNYVAAAAADGSMSLLEWRRGGVTVANASGASPLRCCACDGSLMIAGAEAGQLLMWSLAQLTGQQSAAAAAGGDAGKLPEALGGGLMAGPDGLYPPVSCPSKAAVNGVGVAVTSSAGGAGSCSVLAAMDDGLLVLFSNKGGIALQIRPIVVELDQG